MKTDNFIDIAGLDKTVKHYWKKRSIEMLRQAFDRLKESREFLVHENKNSILANDLEMLFQTTGAMIMNTAKAIRASTEGKKEQDVKK